MAPISRKDVAAGGKKANRRRGSTPRNLVPTCAPRPALASTTGAKIVEVPIENPERKSGKSNYGIGRTIRVFLDLMMVKFLLEGGIASAMEEPIGKIDVLDRP